MKYFDWIKIKEQAAPAPAPAPAPAAATSSPSRPVPQRLFGKRQTSDCRNCAKDWKNWFKRRKRREL